MSILLWSDSTRIIAETSRHSPQALFVAFRPHLFFDDMEDLRQELGDIFSVFGNVSLVDLKCESAWDSPAAPRLRQPMAGSSPLVACFFDLPVSRLVHTFPACVTPVHAPSMFPGHRHPRQPKLLSTTSTGAVLKVCHLSQRARDYSLLTYSHPLLSDSTCHGRRPSLCHLCLRSKAAILVAIDGPL